MAIIPLVSMASLSAVKATVSPCCSPCNHTLDWQPLIMFSSVLNSSLINGKFLPSSIMYSYRCIQSSNIANSSIISSCISLIVISFLLFTLQKKAFYSLFFLLVQADSRGQNLGIQLFSLVLLFSNWQKPHHQTNVCQ